MSSSSPSQVVLDLAEDFIERYRRGERPSLTEYVSRHPALADQLRAVFPAMAMMERIALADESMDGRTAGLDEPSRMPAIAQLGDYRIIREVGRGGMGVVYEAEQVSLGRNVALKVLPPQILCDPKRRHRIEREARSTAKLHHTNIVPVFGVGEQDGTPYYVMQFILGRGLDEVLDELKRMKCGNRSSAGATDADDRDGVASGVEAGAIALSLLSGRFQGDGKTTPTSSTDGSGAPSSLDDRSDDAAGGATESPDGGRAAGSGGGSSTSSPSSPSLSLLGESRDTDGRGSKVRRPTYWQGVARIGVQVAEALEYAHHQGILHRDIKPSNLLLDARGSVWVTDFGLAKVSGQPDLTHTGDLLGTLRYSYMPPEAFSGTFDARGDVYALGLTLYEMLALRPGFDQRDPGRLVHQVKTAVPERLRRLDPEIPRDLETIVHRAVEREPEHRYATAGELAADLQRFLDDEPIRARRASPVERSARWARRNPAVAALAGALAVTLVAATVASLVVARRMTRLADREREARIEAVSQARAAVEARRQAEAALRAAEAQRTRADANFAKARAAVDDYLTKVSESQLLHVPGMQPLRRQLLESALDFYERFLKERGDDPAVRAGLADAQLRVGKILHELGRDDEARRAFDGAMGLYQALVRREGFLNMDPGNAQLRRDLVSTRMALARADAGLGQFDRVRADLAAATALAPDGRALARQAVDLYIGMSLHVEAIDQINRLLHSLGNDRHWTSDRSSLLLDMAGHEAIYARLMEARPDDDPFRAVLGRYFAARGAWTLAADEYRRVIRSSPILSEEPVEYAAVLLLLGDEAGYRAFVKDLVAREGGTTDKTILQILARVCSLGSSSGIEAERVVGWAEKAAQGDGRAWFAHALGLALHRAGRYGEAIDSLERSNGQSWPPIGLLQNDAVLAMAHQREGRTARARSLFDRVDAWCREAQTETALNATRAVDWLALQALHREARALIVGESSLPSDPFAR